MAFEAVKVRLRFDGQSFVPESPLQFSVGTVVEGWLQPSQPQESWAEFIARTGGSWEGFLLEEPEDPAPDPVEVEP